MRVSEALKEAKKQIEIQNYPNVQGVGIGYKTRNGKKTKELAVIIFVTKKVPIQELPLQAIIPKSVCTAKGNTQTDVVEIGSVFAMSLKSRIRPIVPGYSIGHPDITAGTLGLLVKQVSDGKLCVLSNNHVLANTNLAKIGDPILQPASCDGGKFPDDVVAHLVNFVRVETGSTRCRLTNVCACAFNACAKLLNKRSRLVATNVGVNIVDCAIASIDKGIESCVDCFNIGTPAGLADAELGTIVRKSGRTTGYTESEVIAVDATVKVMMGCGEVAIFADQIIAGKMCDAGDSGSAVYDRDNNVVGLLFAGGSDTTIINKIHNVFDALNIELP